MGPFTEPEVTSGKVTLTIVPVQPEVVKIRWLFVIS